MNTLKINNQVVNLPAGFQIPIELNNPIFDKDIIQGEYSLPVTLNIDNTTILAIGIEYLPDSEAMRVNFDAKLTISGSERPCKFKISKYSKTPNGMKLQGQFLFNSSSFANNINTIKLQELLLETLNIPYPSIINSTLITASHRFEFIKAAKSNSDFYNYVVAPLRNDTFFDGVNIQEYWQNKWDPSYPNISGLTGNYDFTIPDPDARDAFWTPFVYIRHILKKIATHFMLTPDLNEFDVDVELKQLVLYNNGDEFKEIVKPFGTFYAPPEIINLSNHVPAVTVSDFLLNLKKMFNLFIYFDEKKNKFIVKTLQQIINLKDEINWTLKVSTYYDIEKVLDDKKLQLIRANDTADEFFATEKETKHPEKDSENVEKINFAISKLREVIRVNGGDNYAVKTPIVRQQGEIGSFDKRAYSMKLMFYRGMVQTLGVQGNTTPSGEYPYLNGDSFDQYGNDIYNRSLDLDGDKGLYKQFHENWWSFYSKHRILTLTVTLTAAEIFDLDWTKKVRIHNSLFYIKSIKGNIGKAIENNMTVELVKFEN
jgi:hypothetical protein